MHASENFVKLDGLRVVDGMMGSSIYNIICRVHSLAKIKSSYWFICLKINLLNKIIK